MAADRAFELESRQNKRVSTDQNWAPDLISPLSVADQICSRTTARALVLQYEPNFPPGFSSALCWDTTLKAVIPRAAQQHVLSGRPVKIIAMKTPN
jgi:hypothetical protein